MHDVAQKRVCAKARGRHPDLGSAKCDLARDRRSAEERAIDAHGSADRRVEQFGIAEPCRRKTDCEVAGIGPGERHRPRQRQVATAAHRRGAGQRGRALGEIRRQGETLQLDPEGRCHKPPAVE